mmetsp:Transcript_9021/g.21248  ORF Transcript_9021/g.21248 Transcript_9021/m.21248 type:complete len:401 (-) Transcript_9021:86-1288(-)
MLICAILMLLLLLYPPRVSVVAGRPTQVFVSCRVGCCPPHHAMPCHAPPGNNGLSKRFCSAQFMERHKHTQATQPTSSHPPSSSRLVSSRHVRQGCRWMEGLVSHFSQLLPSPFQLRLCELLLGGRGGLRGGGRRGGMGRAMAPGGPAHLGRRRPSLLLLLRGGAPSPLVSLHRPELALLLLLRRLLLRLPLRLLRLPLLVLVPVRGLLLLPLLLAALGHVVLLLLLLVRVGAHIPMGLRRLLLVHRVVARLLLLLLLLRRRRLRVAARCRCRAPEVEVLLILSSASEGLLDDVALEALLGRVPDVPRAHHVRVLYRHRDVVDALLVGVRLRLLSRLRGLGLGSLSLGSLGLGGLVGSVLLLVLLLVLLHILLLLLLLVLAAARRSVPGTQLLPAAALVS